MADDVIRSQSFDAPFVRVRGRLSRQGTVRWSPCLRTYRTPRWIEGKPAGAPVRDGAAGLAEQAGITDPRQPTGAIAPPAASTGRPSPTVPAGPPKVGATAVAPPREGAYVVTFEDTRGQVLVRAPVRIRFFAPEREWALFTQRLPFHRDTHRVVLHHGERELGALAVSRQLPEFVLTHPLASQDVDVDGILHLRWDIDKSAKTNSKKFPLTYYVRYSADRRQWHRCGVNITDTKFDLDLRQMPGGKSCVAQVIATNGYLNSYVETPPFSVPRKPPEILLATPSGPLLFAQGFSREEGPLVGEAIVWLADGTRPVGTGASFDVHRLGRRMHQLAVRVTDTSGAATLQHLGWYDGATGLRVGSRSGY
jgi:hypothetical protein